MNVPDKTPLRTGNFEEERKKIVEEYKKGNYLKTIADYAIEKEKERERNENKQSEL